LKRLKQIDGGNHSWLSQHAEQQDFNEVRAIPSFILLDQTRERRRENISLLIRHHCPWSSLWWYYIDKSTL